MSRMAMAAQIRISRFRNGKAVFEKLGQKLLLTHKKIIKFSRFVLICSPAFSLIARITLS